MVVKYRTGVRIIGGRWRGRRIPVSDLAGLRPTPGRIRETLFNWLRSEINGAVCLDLFAGSGALSFEALSRGAARVVGVDHRREVIDSLAQTRELLGADTLQLVCDEAQKMLSRPALTQFDIVFIDPPFAQPIQDIICVRLQDNAWLAPAALIYVEAAKDSELEFPHSWSLLKSKCSGNVQYRLLRAGD